MYVSRRQVQIWAISVILLYTVQINGDTPEPTSEDATETAGTGEESSFSISSVASVEKADEENDEEDKANGKEEVTDQEMPSTKKFDTTTTEESVAHVIPAEKSLSTPESEVRKEEAPDSTFFSVLNSNKDICLLAKFQAKFTITYSSKEGNKSVAEHLPQDADSRGECGSSSKNPTLRLSWTNFDLIVTFVKIPKGDDSEDKWVVKVMELSYDTSKPPFESALNAGKKTARSEVLSVFETPYGKSYFCPSPEVIKLYSSTKQVATIEFQDATLQPYEVKEGKFSSSQRCIQAIFTLTEEPFIQDETVPLAVGLTLAILTLLVVLGFSIYRAYTVRKVDYNSME